MKSELLKGLSDEQIAKAKSCKSNEELLKLAKKEGIELSEEQLEVINGGACSNTDNCPLCPHCRSSNVKCEHSGLVCIYKCKDCGRKFELKEGR